MYNPDLFPGLRCKPMSNKSSCAIVYATGAVVLTGCLTVDECNAFGKTMAALCTPYFCDIASCDARAVKRRKSGPSIERLVTQATRTENTKNCDNDDNNNIDQAGGGLCPEIATSLQLESDAWDDPAEVCNLQNAGSFEEAMVTISAASAGLDVLKRVAGEAGDFNTIKLQ